LEDPEIIIMYALGYSRNGTIIGSIIYFIVTLLSKSLNEIKI
jgi:hypothetical protein